MSVEFFRRWPLRLKVAVGFLLAMVFAWLCAELLLLPAGQWDAQLSLSPPQNFLSLGFALHGQPVADLLVSGARALFLYGTFAVLLCSAMALIQGFFLAAKPADSAVLRSMVFVLDVLGAVPGFLLSTVVLYAMGPSLWSLVLAFAIAHWDSPTRIAWSVGRLVVCRPSYLADVALGYPLFKLFWHHYLPEVFGPLSAKVCSLLAGFIVFGASSVVIGILDPQLFPWGALINQGRHYFDIAPHVFWAGWALIFLSTLVLTLTSSGIHLVFENKIPR